MASECLGPPFKAANGLVPTKPQAMVALLAATSCRLHTASAEGKPHWGVAPYRPILNIQLTTFVLVMVQTAFAWVPLRGYGANRIIPIALIALLPTTKCLDLFGLSMEYDVNGKQSVELLFGQSTQELSNPVPVVRGHCYFPFSFDVFPADDARLVGKLGNGLLGPAKGSQAKRHNMD